MSREKQSKKTPRATALHIPLLHALAAGYNAEEHPIPTLAFIDTRGGGACWMNRRTLDAFVRRGWAEQSSWSKKHPKCYKKYTITQAGLEALKRAM